MMTRITLLACGCLLLAACSDDTTPTTDGPAVKKDFLASDGPDAGGPTGDGPVNTGDQGGGTTSALQAVVNKILVPKNDKEYAYDFDGTGPKNALGSINGTLAAIPGMSGFDFQTNLDAMITDGNFMLLLDVQATSIENAAGAKLQVFLGTDLDSPPNPTDNFSGTEELGVQIGSPKDMLFDGSITASKLTVGPGQLVFALPFGTPPITVTLEKGRVEGKLSSTPTAAITEGRMYGAIPWSEVTGKLIPEIAKGVDATYKSGQAFLAIFDANKDGTITAQELQSNGLLALILKADVDTDGDKVADAMSVGIAFTAVGCKIQK